MDMPALRAGLRLDCDLDRAISDLIVRKAWESEIGTGPRIDVLDRFIDTEFTACGNAAPEPYDKDPTLLDAANELFRLVVSEAPVPSAQRAGSRQ